MRLAKEEGHGVWNGESALMVWKIELRDGRSDGLSRLIGCQCLDHPVSQRSLPLLRDIQKQGQV